VDAVFPMCGFVIVILYCTSCYYTG